MSPLNAGSPVAAAAEGVPFDRDELNALLDIALKGTSELTKIQQAILAEVAN